MSITITGGISFSGGLDIVEPPTVPGAPTVGSATEVKQVVVLLQ